MKKLNSDFVIVDVKRGCHAISKKIKSGKRFKAVIEVELDNQHSRFDGVSIEFSGHKVNAQVEEIEE